MKYSIEKSLFSKNQKNIFIRKLFFHFIDPNSCDGLFLDKTQRDKKNSI